MVFMQRLHGRGRCERARAPLVARDGERPGAGDSGPPGCHAPSPRARFFSRALDFPILGRPYDPSGGGEQT